MKLYEWLFVCLALAGTLFIGPAVISLAGDKSRVLSEKKFTSPLSAGWYWVREDPKAWKVEKGSLLLRSLPGYVYINYNNARNVLLRKERVRNEELRVRMIHERNSNAMFESEPKYTTEGVWLRLVIKGEKASGYYRQTDKEEWRGLGEVDLPAKGEANAGLNAGGGPKDAERWVRFSHFRIFEQAN
jgi:hypothetical protein